VTRSRVLPQPPDAIDQVCAYLDRRHASRVTVPQLAARAGLSTFHFIRVFRARTGATPHQYLVQRRIARAKHLLATTPMAVTEIAAAVGFATLSSFSRVFRKATAETPRQWRGRRRKQPYIPGCFLTMYRAEPR
jgi:AraC family transcriptional regulator